MHRIEYWRNKLNMSQSELGRRAKVSPSYICKLEKGTKIPSLPMVYKIAEALEICPKNLLSCNCKKCFAKKTKRKKALD